ncbi:Syntaxin-5 [Homalodisca vitripennis]|nr:Syntaxin-5 [Homalodisca vitripennis]
MTARRRRGGSESEQVPLIVTTNTEWTSPPPLTYDGPEHTDRQNRLGFSKPIEKEFHKMTSRDRTLEFSNAIRSLASRQVVRAVAARDPRKAKHIQSYGEFMVIARTIGKNITSTYTKLEKLTLLAKRKSLFNDRPAEIQELTYIIKEDLNSLNQQIARLQEVSKAQRQSVATGTRQHLLSHSSSVVLALQSKLANMSNEFKLVLEVRTEETDSAMVRHALPEAKLQTKARALYGVCAVWRGECLDTASIVSNNVTRQLYFDA